MGTGSAGAAALIAYAAFWALLVVGWSDLGPKRGSIFGLLWFAGFVGFRYVSFGSLFFPPYVAVLDTILVLVIFKGDVKLH